MSRKFFAKFCVLGALIVPMHASAVIVIGTDNAFGSSESTVALPFRVQKGVNDAAGFASATVTFSYNQAALSASPTFSINPTSLWPGAFILGCTFNTPGQASCGFATVPPFANPVVSPGNYVIGTLFLPLGSNVQFPYQITAVIEECTDQSGSVLPPGSCAGQNGTINFGAPPPPFIFSNGFE